MGTTGGGVFKTTDGGENWAPMTDRYFGGTIGAIAVGRVQSGHRLGRRRRDRHPRQHRPMATASGRPTDGGKTWTLLGLRDGHIATIRDASDQPGHRVRRRAWASLRRTDPSAASTRPPTAARPSAKVLCPGNDSTGVVDIVMDPSNPNVALRRHLAGVSAAVVDVAAARAAGSTRRTDGGATWTELTRNARAADGRDRQDRLTVSPVNPKRVWA